MSVRPMAQREAKSCFVGSGAWVTRFPDALTPETDVRAGPVRSGRILIVEDQADVRQMLATALELEGHQVDQAADATEGLRRLEEARYDLVLSDYAMPDRTGAWMLREATRRGLMRQTAGLILTAHPGVSSFGDIHVIAKPLDLDRFLDLVNRMIEQSRPSPPHSTTRVELVLYVSSSSAASVHACRNLERLLERFDTSQVGLSICDLGIDPGAGERDCVAFTPTLVKRSPQPRMWVVGDLREADRVADLLRACGVDARS